LTTARRRTRPGFRRTVSTNAPGSSLAPYRTRYSPPGASKRFCGEAPEAGPKNTGEWNFWWTRTSSAPAGTSSGSSPLQGRNNSSSYTSLWTLSSEVSADGGGLSSSAGFTANSSSDSGSIRQRACEYLDDCHRIGELHAFVRDDRAHNTG